MKRTILIFAAMLLTVSTAAFGATKPIMNIEDVAVPAKLDLSTYSLEEVRDAIAAGCRLRGWSASMDGDSQMKCSILVRGKHYAEGRIPFSETSYSIIYSDSRVLKYDAEKQRIHRNYNKWVILLSEAIQRQFAN